ncbi:hypothetical protein T05_7171 [Trichinella murrelli]|uniref:Uncharacterized protein n=1 Tax=Trichinella murrelli TaxID=144512 RepID=A0A0V0TYN7_9BILA|nr:hypothetical protein T05_7171 [Trichinella murrelli]
MQLISQPTALKAQFHTWDSDTVETEDEFKEPASETSAFLKRVHWAYDFPPIAVQAGHGAVSALFQRWWVTKRQRTVGTAAHHAARAIALLLTEIITGWVCLRRANRSQICARLGEKVSQAEVFSVDSVECSNISASFMSHMYLWETAPIHWSMASFFRSHAPRKPTTMESYLTENRCGRNSLLGHSCSIANAVHRLKKSCQNEPRQVVLLAAEFIWSPSPFIPMKRKTSD